MSINGAKQRPQALTAKRTPRTSTETMRSALSKTRSNAKSKLVVFEGVDGVGKTTVVKILERAFRSKGVRCVTASFPGKTTGTLGAHVYALYHDPKKFNVNSLSATAIQLLVTAAHVEAIELLIRPSLEKGFTVILDRYWWSTWVYGEASGVEEAVLSKLIEIEQMIWKGRLPTVLFLLTRRRKSATSKDAIKEIHQLNRLYKSLAARELNEGSYAIYVVHNDGSLRDTVREIQKHLKRLGL